jgi:integration host factor subunit beta
MKRADLIEEVSRAVEVSGQQAADIVEAILNSMVGALQRGDWVEIRGFGSFHTRQRAARIGRNPKTGARVEVLPKKVPYFKPSKEVRDRLEKISTGQVLGGMDKTKTPPL